MVELITDYQVPLAHQGGDVGGVGRKAHSKYHCRRLANEPGYKCLQFIVKVKSS